MQTQTRTTQSIQPSNSSCWFSTTRIEQQVKKGLRGSELQQNAVLETEHPQKNVKQNSEKPDNDIAISYARRETSWKESPDKSNYDAGDEGLDLHGEHHIQALKSLENDGNLHITAGPELIIKDEKHNAAVKSGDQPDSELGVGMHFKYGF